MTSAATRDWPAAVVTAARLVTFTVTCLVLYWGQVVLIPIALAALITFLLTPLVSRLDRLGSPRVLSVLVVSCVTAGVLGGMGYVVVGQLGEFAGELPAHRKNILAKVRDLRDFTRGGAIENVQSTIDDISGGPEVTATPNPPAAPPGGEREQGAAAFQPAPAAAEPEPVRVQIVPERPQLFSDAETWTPALDAAATFGLTMLLAIFMLIWREDLRNRFVSLAGATSMVITTKAVVEAGGRISRYLRMQLLINATMGIAVGVGLFFIGVPYAPLWGFAAAIFRFVPYVGPWIAALLPISVSLITAPGWEQVALVLVLFAVLELLSNNVMEPWLYGQSVGLSSVAIIVSAIFWTWLWGSVGLVLATPLTVCLVVLGRYIPAFAIFDRLLSDRPVLEAHLLLYQRLLSRDEDGAEDIVERHLGEHSLTETCEELLLGALIALKSDLDAGRITANESDFVAKGLREMVEDLPAAPDDERGPTRAANSAAVIGFPVRDTLDEVALHILRVLLQSERIEIDVLSADLLLGERVAAVEAKLPAAVCMASLPPGDLTALRHSCKRLRVSHPNVVQIVVGRLGLREAPARSTELLHTAGANQVHATLAELRDAVRQIARNAPLAAEPGKAAQPRCTPFAPAVALATTT